MSVGADDAAECSFEARDPGTTGSLIDSLGAQRREIGSFFSSLAVHELFAPQGEYWSPADHLRHLAKCVRPVAGALMVPRIALAVRFGRSRNGSRSFEEIVELYRRQLESGATAGPFSPSRRTPDLPAEAWRKQILEDWQSAGDELLGAIESLSDRALDRSRLPHPLLGKLTVREMLFFTLYHNAHHARRVEERRVLREEEAS